jgi:hypothetical protein
MYALHTVIASGSLITAKQSPAELGIASPTRSPRGLQ